jgi:hypothetical protein
MSGRYITPVAERLRGAGGGVDALDAKDPHRPAPQLRRRDHFHVKGVRGRVPGDIPSMELKELT